MTTLVTDSFAHNLVDGDNDQDKSQKYNGIHMMKQKIKMKTNIDNAPQGTPSKDYRRINLIRCQEFSLFFKESIPVRVA